MNLIESQMKLTQDLAELGTSTWQHLSELQSESMRKYQDRNEEFAKKLPEIEFGDFNGWMELQREYGEALWSDFQEFTNSRGEVIKEAMEQSAELVKSVYAPEQPKAKTTTTRARTSKTKKAA